jgi:hypothetical protein
MKLILKVFSSDAGLPKREGVHLKVFLAILGCDSGSLV